LVYTPFAPDICQKWFEAASGEMEKYFSVFKEIMSKVWVECGYQLEGKTPEGEIWKGASG